MPNKYDWHLRGNYHRSHSQEQGSQGQRLSLFFDRFFPFSGFFLQLSPRKRFGFVGPWSRLGVTADRQSCYPHHWLLREGRCRTISPSSLTLTCLPGIQWCCPSSEMTRAKPHPFLSLRPLLQLFIAFFHHTGVLSAII